MLSVERKTAMVKEAWQQTYPTLAFPDDILVRESNKMMTVSNESGTRDDDYDACEQRATMCGRYHVRDVRLSNGHVIEKVPSNYEVVSKADLARYRNERVFGKAMRSLISGKRRQVRTSPRSRMLHAAFASAYPQLSEELQEILIVLARYTLMLDVKAHAEAFYAW